MNSPEETPEQRLKRLDREAMCRPYNNSRAANLRRQQEADAEALRPKAPFKLLPISDLQLAIQERNEARAALAEMTAKYEGARFAAAQHLQTVEQQAAVIRGLLAKDKP